MKCSADTLRMYEMFLGSRSSLNSGYQLGIDGVSPFYPQILVAVLRPLRTISGDGRTCNEEELKSLHKLIKKVTGDIEQFSYNTSISAFMICVNELFNLKCSKEEILEQLVITLAPFAPHVYEELWDIVGPETSYATPNGLHTMKNI